MPNILALLHNNGSTAVSTEIRNGVEQPVIEVDLTYSQNGGEGRSEFILRNTTSDNDALNVEINTPTNPIDPQKRRTGSTMGF